jgi:signal transduction histidine kinase
MRLVGEWPAARNARYVVALTASTGLAVTVLITAAGFEPAYHNRALHVAKETVAAIVLLMLAAVLAGRVSRRGSLVDLLALAGVVVLATKNLVFSILMAILTETSGGLTSWRTTGAGMVAAALLAAAALAPRRVVRHRRRAILLTTGLSLGAFVLLSAVDGIFDFPGALTERPDTQAELERLSKHSALIVSDLAAAGLFLVAGAAFARRAEREAEEFHMWLGIGATIAAIGFLNYALFPSSYADFLYVGDFFRVAAVIAWGAGTIREIARYQAVYAPATVLEDRRRVARDLHDGVAQELAFIASHVQDLRAEAGDSERVDQIEHAVRRALEESRGAISTLNRPLEEPLHLALASTAEDVAARTGARLELDLQEDVAVPPAWEHALPRFVREAVGNAVNHGQARTVALTLRDADGIWLRVSDDGRGFDSSRPAPSSGFGLISMREQTESLGGQFKVTSEPGRGTTIDIVLP